MGETSRPPGMLLPCVCGASPKMDDFFAGGDVRWEAMCNLCGNRAYGDSATEALVIWNDSRLSKAKPQVLCACCGEPMNTDNGGFICPYCWRGYTQAGMLWGKAL